MPDFETDSNLVQEYKYGFFTDIETDTIPKGLNEEVIAIISAKKNEPVWMLEWRLKAFRRWQKMKNPDWAFLDMPEIDFQDIHYYSAPKEPVDMKEMDPELLKTFERLGIPMGERDALSGVAMDVVFDSVSVGTTHKELLEEQGIIFCSISEAIQKHPDLVKQYLGTVVPPGDNFYAALNSAVFTDGSFCYIPKGVTCPVELSTYFRINAADTGQFERTLIVCDDNATCSYLEGCTAPARDTNQLHAAVVEIVALENADVKYSTVQNWYAGDEEGKGGIYNFVTKRGHCRGRKSKISWTQVEVGAAITWKYPSCVLEGDGSVGEFYSVAFTNNHMQADTGTKMIHVGKNTSSTIISKGISAGYSSNNYRGLVKVVEGASNARNHSICDSLLIGRDCSANTFPYIESEDDSAHLAHEATTSTISEDQLFYLKSRGLSEEDAASMVVKGFCKDVFKKLPLEFSVEAIKLLEIKLEGSIG
ncbi:Fe-S cluster assembly protein SufB [Kiritimatiellota bacterium B12222]|nr:Fe-S cluster assembly protein SufB [Kiritimatiellota bacterium B12222]